jgi:hypothetical protein
MVFAITRGTRRRLRFATRRPPSESREPSCALEPSRGARRRGSDPEEGAVGRKCEPPLKSVRKGRSSLWDEDA